MKVDRANSLEVNFVSRATVEGLDKLDRKKLWLMEADAVVDRWTSEDNASWYLRFGSGWIVQGGAVESTTENTAVTLPIAFVNANYTAVAINYTGGSSANYNPCLAERTENSFIWYSGIGNKAQSFGYIAVGMGEQ
jgi:hypothetical protein